MIDPQKQNNSSPVIYIIKGAPLPYEKKKIGHGRVYDSNKKNKELDIITIEGQHDERPPYKGKLELNLNFYFKMPERVTHKFYGIKEFDPYPLYPPIVNCIKYIENISHGILFNDDSIITRVTATKLYSLEPRTEFYIRELS